MPAITFALAILQAIPLLMAAGEDVASVVNSAVAALKAAQAGNGVVDLAAWTALDAKVTALRAQVASEQGGGTPVATTTTEDGQTQVPLVTSPTGTAVPGTPTTT